MPIMEERRSGTSAGDAIVRTISSRIAGGGKIATTAPSQVNSIKFFFSVTFRLMSRMHALSRDPNIICIYRSLWICASSGRHCQTCCMRQT